MGRANAPSMEEGRAGDSMTEEQMRHCVTRLDERVFCVVEAAAPTPYIARVVYEELGRQAADVPRFSLVVDLRETRVPNAATRHAFVEALRQLLPRIDHLALVMGGNNALRWIASWVLQRAGCTSYSTHDELDEARMAAFASLQDESDPEGSLPAKPLSLPPVIEPEYDVAERLELLEPGLFEYREVPGLSSKTVADMFEALRHRTAPGRRVRLLVNLEGCRPIGVALRHHIQREATQLLAEGGRIAIAVNGNAILRWIAQWMSRRLEAIGRVTVHETREQALRELLDVEQ